MLWCVAVAVQALLAAAVLPNGSTQSYAVVRAAPVTSSDAPWGEAATSPWRFVGVMHRQPTYFDTVGSMLDPADPTLDGDPGKSDGEIADSIEVARSEAASMLGYPPRGDVHLGVGRGDSAGLLATLALTGSRREVDLAGCGSEGGCLRVGATGAVHGDGLVHPIGSLDLKLAAVEHSDIDVMFYPAANLDLAAQAPAAQLAAYTEAGTRFRRGGPPVTVAVWRVSEAVAWLCGATKNLVVCSIVDQDPFAQPQ